MKYSPEQLDAIYDKTSGKCHICGKKLARSNYGVLGVRGCWEVEHSVAVARGGTDHANNLFAACISCNRSKGDSTSRSARARNGRSRAPYSAEKIRNIKTGRAISGAAIAGIATLFFAPELFLVAAMAGALVGYKIDVD